MLRGSFRGSGIRTLGVTFSATQPTASVEFSAEYNKSAHNEEHVRRSPSKTLAYLSDENNQRSDCAARRPLYVNPGHLLPGGQRLGQSRMASPPPPGLPVLSFEHGFRFQKNCARPDRAEASGIGSPDPSDSHKLSHAVLGA